jgi:hypothetical protein
VVPRLTAIHHKTMVSTVCMSFRPTLYFYTNPEPPIGFPETVGAVREIGMVKLWISRGIHAAVRAVIDLPPG